MLAAARRLPVVLALVAATASAQVLKPGPWIKTQVPDGWLLHETTHYQIQSQCGLEKAKRLANHMETMNRVYRTMFKCDREGAKPQPIKLFKDEQGFQQYGQMGRGVAAYYSQTDREMVCYDTGKWSDEVEAVATESDKAEGEDPEAAAEKLMKKLDREMEMDLLGVAAHEGWHQYFHWYVGSWVELPSWINEGMGDYFYTAVPKKVSGKKLPAELGRIFTGRMAVLKRAARDRNGKNMMVPLSKLLRYSQRDYYSNPSVCYAEGWGICQFLLHSGNPKYAKVVPNFIRLVKEDTNMKVVAEKAFKDIDIEQLDREFVAWVRQLEIKS
jgi:hypothetical protein